jgi:IPT/TIG domain
MHNLKKMSIPKVAVLATGLTAAVLVAMLGPSAAQATPSKQANCTGCHGSGAVSGTVTAKPSTVTLAAGAFYTVLVTPPATPAGANTGFWIANSDAAGTTGTTTGVTGGPAASATYTAAMKAPAAAGTYYYKVWSVRGPNNATGVTNFATYSIIVAATVAPTVAPTVVPTVVPTVAPPTVAPPTVTPTVNPTVLPPTSITRIRSLSSTRAAAGSRMTIRGTGFGTSGVVKFGTTIAKASSWTSTAVVVQVPTTNHAQSAAVTVTPAGGTASNAVRFRLVSRHG